MPYRSQAQRRWAHTKKGKAALGGDEAVKEWDQASKGLPLPERLHPPKKKRPKPPSR